jgi:hypothetical protein
MFPMRWLPTTFHSFVRLAGRTYIPWRNKDQTKHFPDHGIENGQADKQASTEIDLDDFLPVVDAALRIARSFGPSLQEGGVQRCQ